jgi:spatacsin
MHGLEFFTMPMKILEKLVTVFTEGSGRGLCKRIIAVVKAANVLGLSFLEVFDKQPIDLLQLLALKAQESFEQASLIVQTHSMPAASIAQILAESFLKVWFLFPLCTLFSLAYLILKLIS